MGYPKNIVVVENEDQNIDVIKNVKRKNKSFKYIFYQPWFLKLTF